MIQFFTITMQIHQGFVTVFATYYAVVPFTLRWWAVFYLDQLRNSEEMVANMFCLSSLSS